MLPFGNSLSGRDHGAAWMNHIELYNHWMQSFQNDFGKQSMVQWVSRNFGSNGYIHGCTESMVLYPKSESFGDQSAVGFGLSRPRLAAQAFMDVRSTTAKIAGATAFALMGGANLSAGRVRVWLLKK